MNKYLFFLMVLLLLGCTTSVISNYDKLQSDSLINQSFTDSEIQDLAKILDFVESQICHDEKRVQDCYRATLKKDSTAYMDDFEILEILDYEKQKLLYESLDTTFFNNIWGQATGTKYKEIDGKMYEYDYTDFHLYVLESQYVLFLEKFAKENEFIKKYLESAQVSGSFLAPASMSEMSLFYRRFDYSDIKIQLMYAFHFLQINETMINVYNEMLKSLNLK